MQSLIPLVVFALLHPFHETVTEVEWNAKTERLEVAMRLDALDEQWLKKSVRRPVKKTDPSQWAVRYLQQKFLVAEDATEDSGKEQGPQYHWVGRDTEGPHVWWYFEIELDQGQRPRWIDNRVLFEREPNYSHRILLLGQVPRRSLTLTIQRSRASLEPTTDESAVAPPIDR